MTEPVRPLEALIAEKIAEWRAEAAGGLGDDYDSARRHCADELAALLQAAAPPAPTAEQWTEKMLSALLDDINGPLVDESVETIDIVGPVLLRPDVRAFIAKCYRAAPPERVSEGKDKDLFRQLLESIRADQSCYWWHTAIDNTFSVTASPAVEPREEPTP
jgi:hypothetical protein